MPTMEELDDMSNKLFGSDFDSHWGSSEGRKSEIMRMCLLARQNDIMSEISRDLDAIRARGGV